MQPVIVWFRQDLRLTDNPALSAAASTDQPIIPLYIFSPEEEGGWSPGAAARWWLDYSLKSLDKEFRDRRARLIIRQGKSWQTLQKLLQETKANAVFWNRRHEPAVMKRDEQIEKHLQKAGVDVQTFNSSLLFEPWEIKNKQGEPYQVFTSFWKACLAVNKEFKQTRLPAQLAAPKVWPKSLAFEELSLLPKGNWTGGLRETWQPSEHGGKKLLQRFCESGLGDYAVGRDRPDLIGTSRLSPYLHWGQISPQQVRRAVQERMENRSDGEFAESCRVFLSEIGWREFAHHLLYHFPHTTDKPLREQFAHFPWKYSRKKLQAWQKGQTGYPIVDAGMRELWHTGWMHNRVRMIVASFLTKHLLLRWQEGAKWFWDTLVDADLANNTLGWQWTAGCGADAAPYFRIFNPTTQGERYDPEGEYVRQWVPELKDLPEQYIHQPWRADASTLKDAHIKLGSTYPKPIVVHKHARQRALDAYNRVRKK